MKLAIGGATGLVGAETVRQALRAPGIDSVLAIGRRPFPNAAPELQQIVLDDFENYPPEALEQLRDVDVCIWTVAMKPNDATDMILARHVCQDFATAALKALVAARPAKSPRCFVYYSGDGAERDQTAKPLWQPQYCLMRGAAESAILEYAAAHGIEAAVVRPGRISNPGQPAPPPVHLGNGHVIPSITVEECVAATLRLLTEGIKGEPVSNEQMQELGKAHLAQAKL